MTNAIFLAYVITTCEREQYQCETATNEKDDAVCIWHTSYRYVMWVCLLVSLSLFLSFFLSLFFVPYFGSYFRICHAWNSTICCKVGVNNLVPSRAPPWGPTICTYICIHIQIYTYLYICIMHNVTSHHILTWSDVRIHHFSLPVFDCMNGMSCNTWCCWWSY